MEFWGNHCLSQAMGRHYYGPVNSNPSLPSAYTIEEPMGPIRQAQLEKNTKI